MDRAERTYRLILQEADVIAQSDGGWVPDELSEHRGGWLVNVAVGMADNPCPTPETGCFVCRAVLQEWETTFANLPRYVRYAVIATLTRIGCRRPTVGALVGVN